MRVKRLLKNLLKPSEAKVAQMMRQDWDQRARENARYYIATLRKDWNDTDFFESGAMSFQSHIAPILDLICRGRMPSDIRMLEIGCGAGRLTKRLGEVMGSVDAVDISPEMITRARAALGGSSNVTFHVNNGMDLSMFPDAAFDFAFSDIVFQHIPRKSIVENYIRETSRVLRPGGVFKFQVQGVPIDDVDADTWVGVGFSEEEMLRLVREIHFKVHAATGSGTQYYWLTLIKE